MLPLQPMFITSSREGVVVEDTGLGTMDFCRLLSCDLNTGPQKAGMLMKSAMFHRVIVKSLVELNEVSAPNYVTVTTERIITGFGKSTS